MIRAVPVSDLVGHMPAVTRWYAGDDGQNLLVTVLEGTVVGAGETLVFLADDRGRPCDEDGARLTSLVPWQVFSDGPSFADALDRLGYALDESG